MGDADDRFAILEVLHRYCRALDTRDWELLGTVFAPEAQMDFSDYGGLMDGREATVAQISSVIGTLDATQHAVSNVETVFTPDGATCRSYYHAQHVRHAAPGGENFIVAGTYNDRLERRDGEWVILYRALELTWSEGNAAVLPSGA